MCYFVRISESQTSESAPSMVILDSLRFPVPPRAKTNNETLPRIVEIQTTMRHRLVPPWFGFDQELLYRTCKTYWKRIAAAAAHSIDQQDSNVSLERLSITEAERLKVLT